MAVTIRDCTAASVQPEGSTVVAKPSGLAVDDLMIAWHVADNDGSLGSMGAPTGWNLLDSNAGVTGGHPYEKVWTRVATSGDVAGSTFTFTNSASNVHSSVAILAIVTGTYDTDTPTSAVAFQFSASNSTSHTAPSRTGVVDGLLCTSHGTDSGGTAATYSPPSGMTERADTNSGSGSYTALEVNTLALSSSSATGTQTATCTVSRPWKGSALVVNPSGGGGGGGGGTVSFVGASEDVRGTTNAPVPACPAGVVSGDLLLAFHVSDTRGTLAAMTAPSGWAEIATNTTRSGDVGFIKIWSKTATGSEPADYTFNDSTSATADALIVALRGWDTTDVYADGPTWNSGTSQTTHVAPSVNGVNGGMLLTTHIAGTAGTTRQYSSGPSGMTLAQDAYLSSGGYVTENTYYLALSAAGGTGSKIATLSASAPFVAVALVVQPPLDKSLLPSSITTAEAFGTPFIAGDQVVDVDTAGIAGGAAFGSPTLTVDPAPLTVTITTGIATGEAFGSPIVTVDASDQTISAIGLDTNEAFGTAVVTVASGDQTVNHIAIPSEETFGIPVVTVPPNLGTLYPGDTTFPGADTYPGASGLGPYPAAWLYPGSAIYPGVPLIDPQPQTITATGIVTAEAFGTSVVSAGDGDQIVPTTAIDTAEAFGVPTVTAADPVFTITPDGISSAEAFGGPARTFVFLEVTPPVPAGLDSYYIDGVDLHSYALRIEAAEGLQSTPGVIGEDIVLPGRDGAVEVYGGFGQPRRPDAIGQIAFSLWLKGVDPTTGLIPGGSTTAAEYFSRWDTLVRLLHRRRVTIDHVRPDGSIRRATGHLVPGDSIGPARTPSSPWFGRLKATFAIPASHWVDTDPVTTGQQSLTTGGTLSLSAFSGATAACTELTVTFGAGSNPRLSTSWGHVGWNDVIAAGRQLSIDTAAGTTGQGIGASWTPGYDALTFAPGPRLFEIDPSETLSATLTHTGGGTMTVEVAGKRRYRTS